jgi:hypothetical protein
MGSLMGRRAASLLAASGMAVGMLAVVVCLVGFLSSHTDKSEATAALAVARVARPEHVVRDGHRRPIGRTASTAFFADEAESADGLPANAGLLTALLLWSFFGPIRWGPNPFSSALPGPVVPRSTQCWLYSVVCFFQQRALSALSGVFRL